VIWWQPRFNREIIFLLDVHILTVTFVFSPGILECRREIHLMHFTTGAPHESASAPVVQLEFRGTYNKEFGTHIEIMGDYLVVLLAHSAPSLEKNLVRRMISIGRPEKEVPRRPGRGYQSLYLVDWVKGHVKYVRAPPTECIPLQVSNVSCSNNTLAQIPIFPP
jgi:hypothetical protein